MSFRKRNIGIPGSRGSNSSQTASIAGSEHRISPQNLLEKKPVAGVRPSPVDGNPVTSTGTPSLDSLLAGHAGLVLGSVLLIEESGATDYAGILLRYFAAEGIAQGHHVHVIGASEQWARELPGFARGSKGRAEKERSSTGDTERMKIAWRYERFGDSGHPNSRGQGRGSVARAEEAKEDSEHIFCHDFDLTKRLEIPSSAAINFLDLHSTLKSSPPFPDIIKTLDHHLSTSADSGIHRIVIPNILSPAFYPAFYPPSSCLPQNILRFLHALRSLLKQHSDRVSAMMSLPIALYPRESGLTRWMELLSDGVLELVPFPHSIDPGPSLAASGAAAAQEEKPQGIARIHRLPVFHERGGGTSGSTGVDDDLAFTVTRRRFVIKPFSLPPAEGDTEAQRGEVDNKPAKAQLEF